MDANPHRKEQYKRGFLTDVVLVAYAADEDAGINGTPYTMQLTDYEVDVDSSGEGNVTITLPPVGACKGRTYFIARSAGDDTNTITIQDQDDSIDWTNVTMAHETTKQRVWLTSSGRRWYMSCCQTPLD